MDQWLGNLCASLAMKREKSNATNPEECFLNIGLSIKILHAKKTKKHISCYTSSVVVTPIRKSPEVSEPDHGSESGKYEICFDIPF